MTRRHADVKPVAGDRPGRVALFLWSRRRPRSARRAPCRRILDRIFAGRRCPDRCSPNRGRQVEDRPSLTTPSEISAACAPAASSPPADRRRATLPKPTSHRGLDNLLELPYRACPASTSSRSRADCTQSVVADEPATGVCGRIRALIEQGGLGGARRCEKAVSRW